MIDQRLDEIIEETAKQGAKELRDHLFSLSKEELLTKVLKPKYAKLVKELNKEQILGCVLKDYNFWRLEKMESELFMPMFEIDFETQEYKVVDPLEIVITKKYVRRGFDIIHYTKEQTQKMNKPDLMNFIKVK